MVINEKNNKKRIIKNATQIEPKTTKEFHNQDIVKSIKSWIDCFENKTSKKALIIHGCSGIGKTMLIKLILKECNYCIHYFDSLISRNKKWVQDTLGELINSKGFVFLKRAIVVDDMDAFTNTNDFGGISEIVKLINPLKGQASIKKADKLLRDSIWKLPIIFICNNVKSNKFSELTKECDIIEFPVASHDDLFKIGKKCNYLKKDIKSFVPLCKGDVRYFLNNAQYHNISKCHDSTKENVDTFLYDRVSNMFENKYDSQNILYEYFHDTSMFPSLINENILSNISPTSFRNIPEITDTISDSDLMNTIIYNKAFYDLDELYAYISVVKPIFYMKQVQARKVSPIKFPVILGKNAVIYANKTALHSFYNSHVNCHIDHFAFLRYKLLSLLNNTQTLREGICIMFYYNITPEQVFGSVKLKMFNTTEFKNMKNIKHKNLIKSTYIELK